jgi:hypothetical protein
MLGGTYADTSITAIDYYNGNGYTVYGGSTLDTALVSGSVKVPVLGVLNSYGAFVWSKYYTNNGGAVTVTDVKFSKTGSYFAVVFDPDGTYSYARFAYIQSSTGSTANVFEAPILNHRFSQGGMVVSSDDYIYLAYTINGN